MIIDPPRGEDIPHLRRLWKEGFGDSDAFLDSFFATGFSFDRCRCLFFQGKPAAVLYWFDCLWQERRVAYIYAVATDAAHRGKSFCRHLMEDTHRHLKRLGYFGAVLVPGSRGLFSLYEKLGYQPFCPMTETTVLPKEPVIPALPISGEDYVNLRARQLPPDSILQEGVTIAYLSTFCQLYRTGEALFSLAREQDRLYFQEYLGDPALLPGIVAGFGAEAASVRLPGGKPYAMYLPLTDCPDFPAYFGIALN